MSIVDDMEAISRRMKEIAAEEKKAADSSAPAKTESKAVQSAYIDEGDAWGYALSHDYGDCV